jgi:PAS domain S-box-containing protein
MNKILVVDDSHSVRTILIDILNENITIDLEIDEAQNGQIALDMISKNEYSLVIMDVYMPVKNGLETLKELKSNDNFKDLPVIMCTSTEELNVLKEALSLGVTDYFYKPLSKKEITVSLPLKVKNSIELYQRRRGQVNFMLDKLSKALEIALTGSLITDREGVIEYVNPRLCEIYEYSKEELIGKTPGIFKSGQTSIAVYNNMWSTIKEGKEWRGELLNKRKNGEVFWGKLIINSVKGINNDITNFVASMDDITKSKTL